jgi:DNA-binding protein Fis
VAWRLARTTDAFATPQAELSVQTAVSQPTRERMLDASSGNRTEAARLLKINRRLLHSKMRDHGLG